MNTAVVGLLVLVSLVGLVVTGVAVVRRIGEWWLAGRQRQLIQNAVLDGLLRIRRLEHRAIRDLYDTLDEDLGPSR